MFKSILTASLLALTVATAACNQDVSDGTGTDESDQSARRPSSGASSTSATDQAATDACTGIACASGERCFTAPIDNGGGLLAANAAAGQRLYVCAEPCAAPLVNIITPGYYGPPSSACGEAQAQVPQTSSHKQGNR